MRTTIDVRIARPEDDDAVVHALSTAFFHDSVFQWVYPDPDRRAAVIGPAFGLFTTAIGRHQASFVAEAGAGAALWVPPGEQVVDDEDAEVFGEKLVSLSPADADRLQTLMAMFESAHPEEPAWYLNFVGVVPGRQGQGIGSALMRKALHRADADCVPAYLEATNEDNRRLYERHGFTVISELHLPEGPTVFPMWRDPR
jgi:ribosomal protein S18 acetylase RimI-like enzyme